MVKEESYLEIFLCGKFLNSVGDVFEREFGIESIGPVLILLHQVAQVSHLHIATYPLNGALFILQLL